MKTLLIVLDTLRINDMKSYVNKTPKCLFDVMDKCLIQYVSENIESFKVDDTLYLFNESEFEPTKKVLSAKNVDLLNENLIEIINKYYNLNDFDNIALIDYCMPLLKKETFETILNKHNEKNNSLTYFKGLYLIKKEMLETLVNYQNVDRLINDGYKVCKFEDVSLNEQLIVYNRVILEKVTNIIRKQINEKHMLNGVTIVDSDSTYIGNNVKIGNDTIIYPNTFIYGNSMVGIGCELGPNIFIIDSFIDNGAVFTNCVIKHQSIKKKN